MQETVREPGERDDHVQMSQDSTFEKPKLSQAMIIPPKLKPGNFKLSQAVTIPPKLKDLGVTLNQSSNQ